MIKIIKIKDNKDGSALLTFEYGEDFKDLVKKHYNKKRFTKKLAKRFILEAIIYTLKEYTKKWNKIKD